MTFQNSLTKFSKAISIENQEASTIAIYYKNNNGAAEYPKRSLQSKALISVQSALFKNLYKLLKIEKIQTTADHPESNGTLERSHRILAEYLHYINNEQANWDE